MIKTSVIIPMYNIEDYIGETLESVFRQTQKEIEIIVVDDGSTDGSLEIVKNYQKEHNNLIIVCQENKKLGAARNAGMDIAKGECIYFLDSDDLIEKNTLEVLYDKVKNNNLDFVTFDAAIFEGTAKDEENYKFYDRSQIGIDVNKVYKGFDFWNQFYGDRSPLLTAWSSYFNRNFLERYALRFQENLFHEDNEFTIKVYLKAERMMYVPNKFYKRRMRQGSIVKSKIGFYHVKGILTNIKLIFSYLKEDNHSSNEKKAFLRYWEMLIRKASNVLISSKGTERDGIDVIINDILKELAEEDFFWEILHKRLYHDIKELLNKILQNNYSTEKVHVLDKKIDNWYDKNIEFFQGGYPRSYLEALKNKDGVILYGAGKIGRRMADQFQLKYWENIIGFAVSDISSQEETVRGLHVYSIEDLLEYREKANVFITTTPKFHDEIIKKLKEKGFHNIYPIESEKLLESVWI